MERHQLKRIIEAALLASAQPLSLPQLCSVFDEFDMPAHDDLARALATLQEDCAGRGIELVEVASGFRYQVRQDVHPFVARLWTERQIRYSRALLETLSLIAYRQPITRAEIEQIRGVAVSTNIVRTLEERDWIRVVGYRDLPGKPALFGTTKQFLDYFNLKSLDELPPLSEIRDIEDLDLQLAFGAANAVIPAAIEADDADAEPGATVARSDDSAAPGQRTTRIHDDANTASEPSPREEPSAGAAHEDTPESIA
ncbi:MAG: SMC-Scp complex subunit ScpB [Lysobacterales bacterium]